MMGIISQSYALNLLVMVILLATWFCSQAYNSQSLTSVARNNYTSNLLLLLGSEAEERHMFSMSCTYS